MYPDNIQSIEMLRECTLDRQLEHQRKEVRSYIKSAYSRGEFLAKVFFDSKLHETLLKELEELGFDVTIEPSPIGSSGILVRIFWSV